MITRNCSISLIDYGDTMRGIREKFIVKYVNSISINNKEDHKNTFRGKYYGSIGVLFLVFDNRNKKQYFKFQIIREGKIQRAGLISSEDDYFIENNRLYIQTRFSQYVFELISYDVANEFLPLGFYC